MHWSSGSRFSLLPCFTSMVSYFLFTTVYVWIIGTGQGQAYSNLHRITFLLFFFFSSYSLLPEFEREGKGVKENEEVNFVTPQIERE